MVCMLQNLKIARKVLPAFALASLVSSSMTVEEYDARVFVNSVESEPFKAGSAALLEFLFEHKETRKKPHHFHEMHEKPLHVLAISQDLNSFYHFHPAAAHHGSKPFSIRLATPNSDADNFMIKKGIERPGNYYIFSEFMPMDEAMQLARSEVKVEGPPAPLAPLKADPQQGPGLIVKYFSEQGVETGFDEGSFRAELQINSFWACSYFLPHLTLKIQKRVAGTRAYEDINKLDTWLGMFGHAVLIGSQGQKVEEKTIRHMHSVFPIPDEGPNGTRGPIVKFAPDLHSQPIGNDLYRTWFQWKIGQSIHTWAFAFDWVAPVDPDFSMLQILGIKKCL